ncbi:glycosyltransferase family 4 protein [Flavicella sp.]|uniref:glycosyltransferase family 4 protein n=1 Tax=Flavicella sp. TaxID=2957742 RepID=UPI003019C3B4
MKHKTIWILNQTAGKMDSGWGERHHYLSKTWKKLGYDVKIISGSYNHLFSTQPITGKKQFTIENIEEGIDFCWVKTPKYTTTGFSKFYSNLIYSLKIIFLSNKKLKTPDVLLVSSMPIFPILSALYLKRKFGASKLIFEVRDLWPLTPIYLKGYKKTHPLIKVLTWFEKIAYLNSDAIVSLLPNAEAYITTISKNASKFHYIPNGIDESLVGKEVLPESIIQNIPKNKFIIGYAGTLGMANAMDVFIDMAISLKEKDEIHFIIVGDGYLKNDLINRAGNIPNITFFDKIKKSQVQSMLEYFDVCYISRYASPLYKHGVSYNKYFDYMLAKKAILESSELIKDQVELSNCGIIVEPENVSAAKQGLLKLYNKSKEELNIMGINGYNFVKKKHSYPYLAKKYSELFD